MGPGAMAIPMPKASDATASAVRSICEADNFRIS